MPLLYHKFPECTVISTAADELQLTYNHITWKYSRDYDLSEAGFSTHDLIDVFVWENTNPVLVFRKGFLFLDLVTGQWRPLFVKGSRVLAASASPGFVSWLSRDSEQRLVLTRWRQTCAAE